MEAKSKLIQKVQRHNKDTGSAEVQAALLSGRIVDLTEHCKTHPKDVHSRRGLLKMVSNRRRVLDYLRKESVGRYQKLVETLGIRK